MIFKGLNGVCSSRLLWGRLPHFASTTVCTSMPYRASKIPIALCLQSCAKCKPCLRKAGIVNMISEQSRSARAAYSYIQTSLWMYFTSYKLDKYTTWIETSIWLYLVREMDSVWRESNTMVCKRMYHNSQSPHTVYFKSLSNYPLKNSIMGRIYEVQNKARWYLFFILL